MSRMSEGGTGKPLLGKHMGYPFADGNYSLSLGVAPMRDETWLDIDDHYVAELREKARRLRDDRDAVFLALPGSEPGQAETLALLLRHLTSHYSDFFRVSGAVIENLINGDSWRRADFSEAPLDLAGRLIQEDMCLMTIGPTNRFVLSAGSLCFPFRWELRDKIGLPMDGIHHPVPGYEEKLAGSAERYLAQLKPERPSWRCNWNVVDAPDLYLKLTAQKSTSGADITPDNAGDRLWIRCERQTLRKLPKSGDTLFTIRTYIRPLSLLERHTELANGLLRALEKLPLPMREYKSQLPFRESLMGYLGRLTG